MGAVESIERERVVAVLRKVDDVARTVGELGMPVVEITLDSPAALDSIRALRAGGNVSVLAGTVRTAEDARAAIDAGAEAVVGPAFDRAVVDVCLAAGVPVIPGALTPSELEAAWRSGAALVKLFPGRLVGPQYVRDVLAPLSDLKLIVTGGIDPENAVEFLRAGAVAVGVDASRARAVYDAVRVAV